MKRYTILAVVSILAWSAVAGAQVAGGIHVLPVVAKLAGADGSNWITDLTMSNVNDQSMIVTAMFYRENQAGSLLPLPGNTRIEVLQPGETRTVQDVLANWFPSHGETKGTLLLLAGVGGEGEQTALLAASARVYNNADPEFTYGQTVTSGLFNTMSGIGRSILPGARWDDRVRSNVGVVNMSLIEINVLVTIYAADGTLVAESPERLDPLSMSQWSLSRFGVDELAAPGRVEVRIDPETITWDPCEQDPEEFGSQGGQFIAYISRVDRASGDAEFLLGQNDWTGYADCAELPK